MNILFKVILILLLGVIAIIDYKKYIIPDVLVIIGALVGGIRVMYTILQEDGSLVHLWTTLIALLIVGGVFVGAYFMTKKGIGLGDIKLMLMFPLYYDIQNTLLIILVAMLLVTIVGGVLVVKNKQNLKMELPYAPFVMASVLLIELMQVTSYF